MSTTQINYLNIALMLASLVAAVSLPFEVFLFSYAVLGPLHYLTEISWLHDRQYFTERKWDWTFLVAVTAMIGAGSVLVLGTFAVPYLTEISADLIFMGFGLALVFVVTDRWWVRLCGTVALIVVSCLIHGSNHQRLLFLVYLPTIVHVFIFTGSFILLGSLKHKHPSGHISFAAFLLCAAACFFIRPDMTGYSVSEYVRRSYIPFSTLNFQLVELLSLPKMTKSTFFGSEANLMVARFIAWAYTYHYLNWFSKTSIIGWHKISNLRLVVVILLWAGSVALYYLDYMLGFKWLFLLSFVHVVLEFPLNHRSFIGIGSALAAWFWAPLTAAAAAEGSEKQGGYARWRKPKR